MFETAIAGLPKPAWLVEPEKLRAARRHEGNAPERAKQDAARLGLQEKADIAIRRALRGQARS